MNYNEFNKEKIWENIVKDDRMPVPNKISRTSIHKLTLGLITITILGLALFYNFEKDVQSNTQISLTPAINEPLSGSKQDSINTSDQLSHHNTNSSTNKPTIAYNSNETFILKQNGKTLPTTTTVRRENIDHIKTKPSLVKYNNLPISSSHQQIKEYNTDQETQEKNQSDTKILNSTNNVAVQIPQNSKEVKQHKSLNETPKIIHLLGSIPSLELYCDYQFQMDESMSSTLYSIVPLTKKTSTWSFYSNFGYGTNISSKSTLNSESSISIDSFNQFHSSYLLELGIRKQVKNWDFSLAVFHEWHQYSGNAIITNVNYASNDSGTGFKKNWTQTNYQLYQKYQYLGLSSAVGYNTKWFNWNISPYLGLHYIVQNGNNGSLYLDGSQSLEKISRTNTIYHQDLFFSLGLRSAVPLTNNIGLGLGAEYRSQKSMQKLKDYSLDFSSLFLKVGLQYHL